MLHFSGSYVCYFSIPDSQVAKNVTGGSQPLGSRPAFGPIRTGDGSLAKFFFKDHVARGIDHCCIGLDCPKMSYFDLKTWLHSMFSSTHIQN